jgi:tetratricopeptide (TPR) repeat protein
MSSIIPGFQYDIFISYRQKDNKYDGWVTEFVDNLRRELGATLKEDVSVYFDINLHDGLLETHDVDASLKEKLRCLIFIPVISHTYCDPKSFAWQHEFKAFIEMATADWFGLRVKLPNGNIAPRVLPVRIHDLDTNDLNLCSSILGGVMRCIDFVYIAPGVNRPLRASEDHPNDNLNKIYYRDQINKVANAVEELISSMKGTDGIIVSDNDFKIGNNDVTTAGYGNPEMNLQQVKIRFKPEGIGKSVKEYSIVKLFSDYKKYIYTLLILISVIALLLGRKDLSGLLGLGNQKKDQAALHALNAKELFYSGNTEESKREIALALGLDPRNSSALTTLAAISYKQGDLNAAVKYTLEALEADRGNSTAAYNLGYAFDDSRDYQQAEKWYSEAIKIDSSQIAAYSALGRLYNNMKQPADAVLILKLADWKYHSSDKMYLVHKNLGNSYLLLKQFTEAIRYLESSISLKPDEPEAYLYLARAYEEAGEMTKSIDTWQKYVKTEPDSVKAAEARLHLKEITINHLKQILK